MGIIRTIDGTFQPICENCGIALCWGLSWFSYKDHKKYWDNWKCDKCDPEYFNRWRLARKEELHAILKNPVI